MSEKKDMEDKAKKEEEGGVREDQVGEERK